MRRFQQIKSRILCVAFAPDGRTLTAAAQRCGTLGMWELPGGKFRRWNPCADTWVRCCAYSADGVYLGVGDNGGMVLPFIRARENYDSEFHAGNPFGDQVPIYGLVFSPGSTMAAVASIGVSLWDMTDDDSGCDFLPDSELHIFGAVAWAPNGRTIAATNTDAQSVIVWKLNRQLKAKGKPLRLCSERRLSSVAFSPDSGTLSVAEANDIHLCTVGRTLQERGILRGHSGKIHHLAFHPQENVLVSAGADQTVRFWDPVSGKQRACYDWGIGGVWCVGFAPDGMTCAAGGDGGVVVWDVDI